MRRQQLAGQQVAITRTTVGQPDRNIDADRYATVQAAIRLSDRCSDEAPEMIESLVRDYDEPAGPAAVDTGDSAGSSGRQLLAFVAAGEGRIEHLHEFIARK